MVSPEPQRKGFPWTVRLVLVAVLAGLAMVPITAIVGALMTSTLWRLEPVLGIELGGHSGPADWVLVGLWLTFTAVATALITRRRRRRGS